LIKLFHCSDARSFRVLWLLEELGLPYELELMAFPPRIHAPDYLKINPSGTVPFMIDSGLNETTKMNESTAILQYLVVKYGPTELEVKPNEDSYGAWLNWTQFGESELTYPQAVILRYTLFSPDNQVPRVKDDYTQVVLNRLSLIDAALQGKEYLCANRFTIADISVGYALMLGRVLGLDKQYTPTIAAYMERILSRPAYKAARQKQKPAKKQ
jgi:glutathione S-transferase